MPKPSLIPPDPSAAEMWRDLRASVSGVQDALDIPGGPAFVRLLADLADPGVEPTRAADTALAAGVPAEEIGRQLLCLHTPAAAAVWGAWAGMGRFDPLALLPDTATARLQGPMAHRDWMVRHGDATAAAAWAAWWATAPEDLRAPWADPIGGLRDDEGEPLALHGLAWALWREHGDAAEVWWAHRNQLPAAALDEAWVALTSRLLFSPSNPIDEVAPPGIRPYADTRTLDVHRWAGRLLDAGANPLQCFRVAQGGADRRVCVDPTAPGTPTGGLTTTTLHAWVAALQQERHPGAWMGGCSQDQLWADVIRRLPWSEAGLDDRGRSCADMAIEADQIRATSIPWAHDEELARRTALHDLLEGAGAWRPTVHAARWAWRSFVEVGFQEPDVVQARRKSRQRAFEYWATKARPVIDATTYVQETARIWEHHVPGTRPHVGRWWNHEAALWGNWLSPDLRAHWSDLVGAAQPPHMPVLFPSKEAEAAWRLELTFKRTTLPDTPVAAPPPRLRI